jgi:predicted aspartyl protease
VGTCKFRYEDGVIYVFVTLSAGLKINRHQFLIDTGASETFINKKTAEGLGFDMDKVKELATAFVATASDFILPKKITLKTFEALGTIKKNYTVNVADFPDDIEGIIGNDFLEKLGTVKINYDAKEIETG